MGERQGGFQCVLARPCEEPVAELERFHRSLKVAGRFAHALHRQSGASVRGVQALMADMEGCGVRVGASRLVLPREAPGNHHMNAGHEQTRRTTHFAL